MLATFAIAAAVATASPSPAQGPPSPQAFYEKAVETMRDLPQPPYVTYTMDGQGNGLSIRLIVEDHLVWLQMTTGSRRYGYGEPMEARWTMQHRTDDYATEIVDDFDGRRYVSSRAFFDPTWYGAFRALRDGMLFYQPHEAPMSSYATPTPGPPTGLPTIAVETVIGSSIYTAQDAGPAVCYNGDDGHAIHLVPKDRNRKHQLTDVVVDIRNMRFCSIRFNAADGSGFHGTVEQHYANVAGYWMQTDGVIYDSYRIFGIRAGGGEWSYQIQGVEFPRSISTETFSTPYDQ
jgi:hypothetical protein